MNLLLAIPIEFRLALLFAIGTVVGGWLNLAIYRLAWTPRLISPWSKAPNGVKSRTWSDRLPIIGWLSLRRESTLHGRGFWIRPMLLEIGVGLSLVGLYWWEIVDLGLMLPPEINPVPPGAFVMSNTDAITHAQFVSHVLLFVLMVVGSFIDIDEKIIPDTVTVPGTLAGLALATLCPWSLLSGNCWLPVGAVTSLREFLNIASPNPWPAILGGAPTAISLAIAMFCWWAWCFAIMPRRWLTRRGIGMAVRVMCARLQREPLTWWIVGFGIVGSAAISGVWKFASAASWAGLLTSLVGMAASGGLIWLVRVIGSAALGREAMGFGDVTLMAMIGTFVGWQASLIIFFVAPFAGLLVGLTQWMLHRDNEIPYGPYLCLATSFVIVCWVGVWETSGLYFQLGWLVPAVILVCMVLMGVLLTVWRVILSMFVRSE